MGKVADLSEVHAASTFGVEVPAVLFKTQCYIYIETHQPTHFDPEEGGSMYLRNVGNIAHIHTM
jgi:hypothetical protein